MGEESTQGEGSPVSEVSETKSTDGVVEKSGLAETLVGFVCAALALSAVLAVCIGIYSEVQSDRAVEMKASVAADGPESSLQQLAQYQGYHFNRYWLSRSPDLRNRVLMLTRSSDQDGEPILVRVSEDVWHVCNYLRPSPIDVVEIERLVVWRIKDRQEKERQEKEHQESLERIRRGESAVDPLAEKK